MRKKAMIIFLAALILGGCGKKDEVFTGAGQTIEPAVEADTGQQALDEFVDTQDKEGELDGHVTDKVGMGDISQGQSIASQAEEVLSDYYGIMFNFGPDTEDYSDRLSSYYTDDLTWNARSEKNVYGIFSKTNTESSFIEYKAGESAIFENADGTFIRVTGYVKAKMSSDLLEEGIYCNACENMFRIEEDGSLSFVQTHVIGAYKEAGFSLRFSGDSEVVDIRGDMVLQWNFYNPAAY